MATQYYNKASRIDMHEPSTWVGKGTTKFFWFNGPYIRFIVINNKQELVLTDTFLLQDLQ